MNPEQEAQIKTYVETIALQEKTWEPQLKNKLLARHNKKVALFKSQDGLCCLCGKPMNLLYKGRTGLAATFEHVKLASLGGTMDTDNVPLSHGTCNSLRGSRDFYEFKRMIEENGGTPPKDLNKNQMEHEAFKKGAEEILENKLAKKINAELFLLAHENGWVKASVKAIEASHSFINKIIVGFGEDKKD